MSDTPRTDAAVREVDVAFVGHDGLASEPQKFVDPDFARELERENAALREDKERMDWLLTHEGGSWLYWAIERGEWTPEVGASRAAIDAARKEAQP